MGFAQKMFPLVSYRKTTNRPQCNLWRESHGVQRGKEREEFQLTTDTQEQFFDTLALKKSKSLVNVSSPTSIRTKSRQIQPLNKLKTNTFA